MVVEALACGITGGIQGIITSFAGNAITAMLTSGPVGLLALGLLALVGYSFIKHHIIWVLVLVMLPFLLC